MATSRPKAYAYGETAWPPLVYDGERLVGFVMAFFDMPFQPGDQPRSGLWRPDIAADTQGTGSGRFAVEQVAAEIRRRGGGIRVCVTYLPGKGGPTGGFSGDQEVAELELV
ncbi:GNAT family N-acetyltransferase [Streptomyces sp. CB01881]|uniref:GNAT family N-acetyltransferase n=1 Tax=Streptomyces sp. CB01881 TaxID=2078691 RepID=UPI001F4FA5D3|nr:GNAT family N-acetyltransferase [Streptomyces sp. CB01881]